MSRRAPVAGLLAMLVAAGCAWPPTHPGGSRELCFQEPAVEAYLANLRRRVRERFEAPPGVPASEQVRVRFELSRIGAPVGPKASEPHDPALAGAALLAVAEAAPFGNLEGETRCLEGKSVALHFAGAGTEP